MFFKPINTHFRIIGALILREMSTRFGREGFGFAWIILEPLVFCVAVIILWTLTKPAYEHGIRVSAFTMTGYMCILLMRHLIQYSVSAMQANVGLLHHRHVKPIHIYVSRHILEFGGATGAFVVVYVALIAIGQISPPHNYLLLYCGWLLLAWSGIGLATVMAGLAIRFEMLERVISLFTYLLIPLSGAFFMIAWLPPKAQKIFLMIPFPHAVEMLRAGVFGEFVETHYNFLYPLGWGMAFNIIGLLLIASARDRIEIE